MSIKYHLPFLVLKVINKPLQFGLTFKKQNPKFHALDREGIALKECLWQQTRSDQPN